MKPGSTSPSQLSAKMVLLAIATALAAALLLMTLTEREASAAVKNVAVVQGESMNLPDKKGRVVGDSKASGNRALLIWSDATATKSFTSSGKADRMIIKVKDSPCKGRPTLKVSVDGRPLRDVQVGSDAYKVVFYRGVDRGNHTLKITMTGDKFEGSRCDRNVWVDYVIFQSTGATASKPKPATTRIQGFTTSGLAGNPSKIDAFNNRVGSDAGIAMWFERFGEYNIGRQKLDQVGNRGATPMVTLEPHKMSLASIANGRHDAWIDNFAGTLGSYDKPVIVRFAHEMNGTWYPWAGQPSSYKDAFRRVSDRIEARAPKAQMAFVPNVDFPIARYYPGDAYVDWLGLDGYNFGQNRPVQSPRQVFARSYDELVSLTPRKPVIIGETASLQYSGKAAWITDLYTDAIPNRMPRVKAVVWFDNNKERDWRVNSSRESLNAYKRAVQSSNWQGQIR